VRNRPSNHVVVELGGVPSRGTRRAPPAEGS